MNYRNNHSIQNSQGNETPLTIVESVISVCKRHTRKHLRSIGKIEARLFKGDASLCFVPSESHGFIVYTL